MISIIDRYIAKYFLLFFLAGLLVFVTIFVAIDFLSFFIRHDTSTTTMIKFYTYYTPIIVHQMIPVAALLATVFTLSTLQKNNELVALFSVGMSLARACTPVLILVALISAFSFWLSDRINPVMAQKKNYTYYVEIQKRPGLYSTVKTNKIWYRSENVLFNIKTLNAEQATAQGITLYYFNSAWEMLQLITAEHVTLQGSSWELHDGMITLFTEDSGFPLTQSFKSKKITMDEELADLQSTASSSEVMSIHELKKFIERNKEAGLETLRYEVDYHGKFGFAFAAFVMSLMGIPFSVSRGRSGGGIMNFGICIGLAFLYWAGYSSAMTLGKHGVLPPVVAAWGPNLGMMALSVLFLLRLKK